MPAEARVTSTWKNQKLLVAVCFIGFAFYFFWDGAVGYPAADRRYHEWKEYQDSGRAAEWPGVAKEHGWKADEWNEWIENHQHGHVVPDRWGRGKYIEQFVCGGLALVPGLIVLIYWLTQKGRTIRTDEEAVYSPAGTRVPFETITGLGKKDWEEKGYATILYKIEGRQGKFLLDDYKFEREATHQILAEVEEKLLAREKAPSNS